MICEEFIFFTFLISFHADAVPIVLTCAVCNCFQRKFSQWNAYDIEHSRLQLFNVSMTYFLLSRAPHVSSFRLQLMNNH